MGNGNGEEAMDQRRFGGLERKYAPGRLAAEALDAAAERRLFAAADGRWGSGAWRWGSGAGRRRAPVSKVMACSGVWEVG